MDVIDFCHPDLVNRGGTAIPGYDVGYSDLEEALLFTQHIGDEALDIHYRLVRAFLDQPRPGLYLNKEMIAVMSSIEKSIPLKYLPTAMFTYIQFPEGLLSDGEDEIIGAYFFIGHGELLELEGKFNTDRIFAVSYICKDIFTKGSLLVKLDERKLGEILQDYPSTRLINWKECSLPKEHIKNRETLFRIILNFAIFVTVSAVNENRDFLIPTVYPKERPTNKKLHKIKRDKSKRGLVNFTETEFLYFDGSQLKKMIPATTGKEIDVSGHFRWQPYGHERKFLKLIWINEHQRVYNKQSVKKDFENQLDAEVIRT